MEIEHIKDEVTLKNVLNIADEILGIYSKGDNNSLTYWKSKFHENPELLLFSKDSDEICGFPFGIIENSAVTLRYVGVKQKYQRQGIYVNLLRRLKNKQNY
ncbi:MAG: hypothetical protein K0Q49_1625 [Haloplasmataceae bacterium]|jgi:hypothetical protein|nr:hypothetical protein [Haloplasmataceae bacterium]